MTSFSQRKGICLTILWVGIWLLLSTSAWAQDLNESDQLERAQQLVIEARAAASRGDHQGSIKKFEAANDLLPSPNNLFAIASVYERIEGSCAQALEAWDRFTVLCQSCMLKDKGKKRLESLKQQCSIELTIESIPIGAQISFDGNMIGNTPFTFPSLAGRHTLTLNLKGYHSIKEDIILLKGSRRELKSITLSALVKGNIRSSQDLKSLKGEQHTAQMMLSSDEQSSVSSREELTKSKGQMTAWVALGSGLLLSSIGLWAYLSAANEVAAINEAKSIESLESSSRNSNYEMKEAVGYVGMSLGIGLSAIGIIKLSF